MRDYWVSPRRRLNSASSSATRDSADCRAARSVSETACAVCAAICAASLASRCTRPKPCQPVSSGPQMVLWTMSIRAAGDSHHHDVRHRHRCGVNQDAQRLGLQATSSWKTLQSPAGPLMRSDTTPAASELAADEAENTAKDAGSQRRVQSVFAEYGGLVEHQGSAVTKLGSAQRQGRQPEAGRAVHPNVPVDSAGRLPRLRHGRSVGAVREQPHLLGPVPDDENRKSGTMIPADTTPSTA